MPIDDAQFASLVAKTSADHSELESGMRRGEQIVKQSGEKMQGSLAKVGQQSAIVQGQNEKLTRGFAAMGAAGTLAGSQFGGIASGAAGLTGAMMSLGIAMGPVTLALAAAAAIALHFASKAGEAETATDEWKESFTELSVKLEDVRRQERLLTGAITEREAAVERARAKAGDVVGLAGAGGAYRTIFDWTMKIHDAEQRITAEKERQAAATAKIAEQKTKEAAALAKSVQQEKTIADLIVQTDVTRGIRSPFAGMDARERHLREVLSLEQQIKAKQAEAAGLAAAQEARTKALASQLAIAAGLVKATDLIGDPTERRLAELLAGITGGVAAPGTPGGFSISARPSEQFRFGAPRPGAETIGPQNEQAKTTAELKKVNANLDEVITAIQTASPDVLSTLGNTAGGMGT